jgi:putative membrane protein
MSLSSASELALLGFALISISLIFVSSAYFAIRLRKFRLHKNLMGLAILSNSVFLVVYIIRFLSEGNTEFPGPDWFLNFVYLPVLTIHISTAIISIYYVFRQLYSGWRGQTVNARGELKLQGDFKAYHKKQGYKAILIWGASFVGGILVFVMLYLLFD